MSLFSTSAMLRPSNCLLLRLTSGPMLLTGIPHRAALTSLQSWRGILATGHGHEPFNDGSISELLVPLKINDFHKGALSDQRYRPTSPFDLADWPDRWRRERNWAPTFSRTISPELVPFRHITRSGMWPARNFCLHSGTTPLATKTAARVLLIQP